MERIAGVILAGGRSTRMGGADKPLLSLAGKPLLGHVIERLRPQVSTLAINANGDPSRFAAFGLEVVADDDRSYSGPLAGILAGMRWAAGLTEPPAAIVTAAADTPFFPNNLVERLVGARGNELSRIAIASSRGNRHPTFGLWPLALADALAGFIADGESLKVTAFIDRCDNTTVDFPSPEVDPFFNVNTPEDLVRAEAISGKPA